jgi:hypothetical protein
MFVARFVALVALAVWTGGMVTALAPGSGVPGDLTRWNHALGYLCGGAALISLFILKFVGPPPSSFPLRAGGVVIMLLVEGYAQAMQAPSTAPTVVNIVLALALLSWYARE